MRNLDQVAAQTAQHIVGAIETPKELDTLATKTLGVLQENGVYACVLFLDSRSSKKESEMAKQIRRHLQQALVEAGIEGAQQSQNLREWIANHLANKLDDLLLVKGLWEQTLIYVRYGAKAKTSE